MRHLLELVNQDPRVWVLEVDWEGGACLARRRLLFGLLWVYLLFHSRVDLCPVQMCSVVIQVLVSSRNQVLVVPDPHNHLRLLGRQLEHIQVEEIGEEDSKCHICRLGSVGRVVGLVFREDHVLEVVDDHMGLLSRQNLWVFSRQEDDCRKH